MKYRTIMDRFGDETVADLVVKRDLHNRWMVYGQVEHSYKNRAILLPVGCGRVLTETALVVTANYISADRFEIRVIDDDGNVVRRHMRRDELVLRGE